MSAVGPSVEGRYCRDVWDVDASWVAWVSLDGWSDLPDSLERPVRRGPRGDSSPGETRENEGTHLPQLGTRSLVMGLPFPTSIQCH